MTERTYWRLTLLLPVLVPLIAMAWITSTGNLGGLSGILALSLPFGGAAYLITASLLWFLLNGTGPRGTRRLALWAPWLMAVMEFITYPLLGKLTFVSDGLHTFDWPFFLKEGLVLAGVALVLSYAYVGLSLVGYAYFQRLGRIEQPTAL